ncbi:MAG: glycoside hydrolase family 9 protein [Suilimivivens sp.]
MGIYVDQVGYPSESKKTAVSTSACNFQVIQTSDQKCVLDGIAIKHGPDASSGDETWQIDFSDLKEKGSYYILSGKGEKSPVFSIGSQVYQSLQKDLTKALYFQRCGCALTEEHAGVYTHKACHTSPAILFEDFKNHTEQPKTFDMTGGWHDAGDFGRYTTAGSVAVGHLLYAYELFPESFRDSLNIPESGNGMPDILNECLYELEWLMKMQFADGSVSHKLTAFCHADFIMPEDDHDQFLIYPASSMAAADFAAVMALASRVYKPFLPDFAEEALAASRKSFDWLLKNPYIGFRNPEGSNTGEYDDTCDMDERMWASAELLRSDSASDPAYIEELEKYVFSDINKTDFGWTDVSGFALLSVLTDPSHHAGERIESALKDALFTEAKRLLSVMEESGYLLAMKPEDFCWGSNMVVCNRSMLFILAALLSEGEEKEIYRQAAMEQLHYLLGRNALNISYVTGHGEHAFKNPHNRPTFADGIELPMKGWVSGGPFRTPCDPKAVELIPQGTPPMKCYVDEVESYSTNEITIYWNSPAVFMTAYFNSL